MKTIVISGGLGYVGGRLSKYFAEKGYQVYALSRSKKVDHPNITVLSNQEVLEKEALDQLKINAFIHLAATNEIVCSQNPTLSNEVNINGTINWLDWCHKKKVDKFIYFSTVHVYSRPLLGEFHEKSNCHPNHPYSISHKCAEDYVLWYQSDFGLDTKIIRLSNSFGYPAFDTADRWTLLVNDLCRQIVENSKFEIRSNIEQHRDFITLSEVCEGVETLILNREENSQSIYNLSKGNSESLFSMAERIKSVAEKYFGKNIEMIYDPSKSTPSETITIKNEELRKLGWQPKNSFNESEIIKTLDYFNKSNN